MSETSTAPAEVNPETPYTLAVELLGGQRLLRHTVTSDAEAHEVVERGIPSAAIQKLVEAVVTLSGEMVLDAIGVSRRSFARRKAAPRARLGMEESGRLWRFAEILGHATRVFGSQERAERWLTDPALGLDKRRPIDLLRTPPGARMVAHYLTRIEHGVYT
jgi:putative toxin-antitoxin system antitoxin component (TIGR02293 family)